MFDKHVLRQRDDDGAGASLHGCVEGARDDLGNACRIIDLRHPFGDRAEDGAVIHLLEGAAPTRTALHLPDEHDQRRRIMFGDVDARRCIGRSGAAGDEDHAGAAREARGGIGHHRGAAFLPAHGHLHRCIVEGV